MGVKTTKMKAKKISNQEWIDASNKILNSYDFRITLRQLFYVLVSNGFIKKTMQRYKSLYKHSSKGRKAGKVKWDALIDSTREIIDKREEYLTIREKINRIIYWVKEPYILPEEFGQKNLNIFYLEKDSLKPFIIPTSLS